MEDRKSQQNLLVEELGRHFEQEGKQPVAARIFALLMVGDQEELTFDQIIGALQISKSSASNGLKLLELRDLVEYVTYTGDRKRYFRVKTKEIFSMIDEFEMKINMILELNKKVIDLKIDKSSRVSTFLLDLNMMIKYFQENIQSFKQSYSDKK